MKEQAQEQEQERELETIYHIDLLFGNWNLSE
jgi:hypothetical protein